MQRLRRHQPLRQRRRCKNNTLVRTVGATALATRRPRSPFDEQPARASTMRLLATTSSIAFTAASYRHAVPPEMDQLMVFGFFAAFLTLVVGLYARQSRLGLATFAACLTATAVYGFMQGAWPIAIVQAAWAAVVFGRSWRG